MSSCPKCKTKGYPVNLEKKEYYCHKCGRNFTDKEPNDFIEDIMSMYRNITKK